MRELEGKNAVVTGSNRGIGKATVIKLAENGCNIWACARKKTDDFEAELNRISSENNVKITPIYFDLSDETDIKENFKEIYKTKESIDILVNAAGIVNVDLFQMTSMKVLRNVFETNFFGAAFLTQLVLKVMTRQRSGSIVNVASISGLDVHPSNCTYGSSKAALIAFTKLLASEVGSLGIRVNGVAPGPTDTDMIRIVQGKVGDAVLQNCAMNRFAKVEEIAEAILFLASDKSSFINGEIIRIDGGLK
ncbi:MAG: SDR family oxidoreductase [Lachnospiraceae bacterium]|nr:SDR family oxidoreductase [Lachnospiraceae bacterium]